MRGFLPQRGSLNLGTIETPSVQSCKGSPGWGRVGSKIKESWGQDECCVHVCTFVRVVYTTGVCLCVHKNSVFILIPSGPDSGLSRNTSPTGMGTEDPPTEQEGLAMGNGGTVQELEWRPAGLLKPSKSQSLQVLRSPGSAPPWQPQVAFECGRLT